MVELALSSGEPEEPIALEDGGFAIVRSIGAQRNAARRSGYVVAVFASEEGARRGESAIAALRDDLALGLRLRRQAADADALVQLSTALAEIGAETDALRRATEIIRERTRSDGAEVVARNGNVR